MSDGPIKINYCLLPLPVILRNHIYATRNPSPWDPIKISLKISRDNVTKLLIQEAENNSYAPHLLSLKTLVALLIGDDYLDYQVSNQRGISDQGQMISAFSIQTTYFHVHPIEDCFNPFSYEFAMYLVATIFLGMIFCTTECH